MSPQTCLTSYHSLTWPRQLLDMKGEDKICTSALRVKREVVWLAQARAGGRDNRRSWTSVSHSSRGTSGCCREQGAGDFWGPSGQKAMQETEFLGRACASAALGEELSIQHCFKSSSAAQTARHWPWRGMRAVPDLLGREGRTRDWEETFWRLNKEHYKLLK